MNTPLDIFHLWTQYESDRDIPKEKNLHRIPNEFNFFFLFFPHFIDKLLKFEEIE